MENSNAMEKGRVSVPDVVYDKTVNCDAAVEVSLADYLPEIKRLLRVQATVMPPEKYVGTTAVELSGTVELTEMLGDNANVYVDVAGEKVILKVTPHEIPAIDSSITFCIPIESVYFFDGKTENAIVRTRVEKDFELFRIYMLSLGYEISNQKPDRFNRSWLETAEYEK